MKVLCTGISGSGREEYLKRVIGFAEKKGEKIKLYSIGDLLQEQYQRANVTYPGKNILEVRENELKLALCGAYDNLTNRLTKKDDIFVSTHTNFFWRDTLIPSHNHVHIGRLNPDLFITIIDDTRRIEERLNGREQWSGKLTNRDVELWQNVEVNNTQRDADYLKRKHYVLASLEEPAVLYNFMFKPDMNSAYVSYPMSHTGDEQLTVNKFVTKLRTYFNVINPGTIEIGKNAKEIAERQTVYRDINWWIRETDITVAFFHVWVASMGVATEIRESKNYGKDTFVILPQGIKYGPFEKAATKIFYSPEEFFTFLENDYFRKDRHNTA